MARLPLPNDVFDDGIVIASVWGNDMEEYGTIFGTICLLRAKSPYYQIGQIKLQDGKWKWVGDQRTYFNINVLIEDYAQSGGDV